MAEKTPAPDMLPEDIQEALEELCDQGEEAMDEGDFTEALALFRQALALLPPPAAEWDPYGWLQAAIGDAFYHLGNYPAAREHFAAAEHFAGADEVSAFVLLRLGQCCRRQEQQGPAIAFMQRALAIDGEDAFADSPEDLAFLRQHAKPL